MARGSFGGGRGSSGGFRSSGSSGRSSGSFSSYSRSSGARPSSGGSSFRSGNSGIGSFIAGAILGSIFDSNKTTNATPTKNQVFPEMGNQTLSPSGAQPVAPVRQPKFREFKQCEYCGAEYTDLQATKCDNCGAKLTHKRVEVQETTADGKPIPQAAPRTVVVQKKKSNVGIIIAVIAIVLAIVVIAVVLSPSSNDNYTVYSATVDTPAYDGTYGLNDTIYGTNVIYVVKRAYYEDNLTTWGIDCPGCYKVVEISINNDSWSSVTLTLADIMLTNGGSPKMTAYEAAIMDDATYTSSLILFEGSNSSKTLILDGKCATQGYLIFPVYAEESGMCLDIAEYSGNIEVGRYQVELD